MTKLTIKQLPIEELVPYANNARIHSAEQIDTIKASIEKFGFNDPIGVWTNKDGKMEIVEGHGRVLAASQMGIEKVPTVNLDHLTDGQRRAYALVHNQTTDNSMWDYSILDAEIEALTDYDMPEFGFDVAVDTFDLLEKYGFSAEPEATDKFYLSLALPASEKETVEAFIKENTREPLVEAIISKCKG